ncbi:hypothetical protein chiPu_0028169, partial [Chiloscyllium punctatum]|nr:hypothetical protein [Chiloscyllium punctatum]
EHDVGDDIYDCVPCESDGDDIYEDIIKVEVRQPMVNIETAALPTQLPGHPEQLVSHIHSPEYLPGAPGGRRGGGSGHCTLALLLDLCTFCHLSCPPSPPVLCEVKFGFLVLLGV